MYREIDPIELGGTLYTPAIHKNLTQIAQGKKFPFLRSVVFCLEDAIRDDQLDMAMENIEKFLSEFQRSHIKIFLRPRDVQNLIEILQLKSIEKIDGFALAKISFKNMQNYFTVLNDVEQKYHIMPVLESTDIFHATALKYIRDYLLNHKKHNILTLRFGAEDMFGYLGLRRSCKNSIHKYHIASKVFGDLMSIFKVSGFNITAPVYSCLENKDTFQKEVQRDLKEGFMGKTVIHPDQAYMINELYKVSDKLYQQAQEILNLDNEAVFRFDESMCEPSAHTNWAKNIIKRYKFYNI